MRTILRASGLLLLLGTVVFSVGEYASFQQAQVAEVRPLLPGTATTAGGEGWLSVAPWAGIALMALGLLAALTVLVIFIRDRLVPKNYVNYGDENRKPREEGIEDTDDIVTILNTMLQVEYANIVNWPRWVSRVTNPDAADNLSHMARDSIRHFDTTVALIRKLGGSPSRGFELKLQKDEADIRQILVGQLDREKLAKLGYQRASELTSEEDIRRTLVAQASEEEEHIQLIQEALDKL